MRRHPHHAHGISLLLVLLPALALAGWDTNTWPSYSYQRQGKTQLWQCWSATVERCQAVLRQQSGIDRSPAAPVWYRTQRTTLAAIKTSLHHIVPNYVDVVAMSNGNAAAYLNGFPSWDETRELPMLSETGLLATLQMPTNYFSYTPRRCLNGNGPFATDAAAVGHNHGWTNANTATNVAGSFFPAGRTAWYTTDYGLDRITNIFSRLSMGRITQFDTSVSNKTYYWGSGWHTDTWATAKTICETNYQDVTASPRFRVSQYTYTYYDASGGDKGYSLSAAGWKEQLSGAYPATNHNVAVTPTCVFATFFLDLEGAGAPVQIYNPCDTAYSLAGNWTSTNRVIGTTATAYGWQSVAASTNAAAVLAWVGSTNFPTWYSVDPVVSPYTNIFVGYSAVPVEYAAGGDRVLWFVLDWAFEY